MARTNIRKSAETMVDVFLWAADAAPDQLAVIVGEDQATYAQYRDAAAAVAGQLAAIGVQGERVVVLMANSVEMSAAIYGVWGAGGAIVLLNPQYTERELGPLIEDADPKAVIYSAAFGEKVEPILAAAGVESRIALGPGGTGWAELAAAGGDYPQQTPAAGDIAALQYTGGTTGLPKGAVRTHAEFLASTKQVDQCWPGAPGETVWLNVAPQFHIWGLTMTILAPMLRHDTVVMTAAFDPATVLSTIPRHGVTLFAGGPAPIFNGLMAHPDFKTTDFSSLTLCGGGGSAIPLETDRAWKAVTGVSINQGYGMSEGAPISLTPAGARNKIETCGPVAPDTAVRIVDVETGDTELATGEDGEICFRGPQMMQSYWKRPEETAAAIRDGWLHTGDIGHLDADGEVVIVDRKKDMAIVNGYNVFPREIDEVLFSHPEVADAAAVGVPHRKAGEVIHAYVVRQGDSSLSAEDLTAWCEENLVGYKVPAEIVFTDALPKTGAAKTDKLALRQQSIDSGR